MYAHETDLADSGIDLRTVTIDEQIFTDGKVEVYFQPLGASSQHTVELVQTIARAAAWYARVLNGLSPFSSRSAAIRFRTWAAVRGSMEGNLAMERARAARSGRRGGALRGALRGASSV